MNIRLRCEDFPGCGHGPPPWGDGGGCPDADGRFNCVLCNKRMDAGRSSSICKNCLEDPRKMCSICEGRGCYDCEEEALGGCNCGQPLDTTDLPSCEECGKRLSKVPLCYDCENEYLSDHDPLCPAQQLN